MFKEWINKLQRKVKSQQLICCKKNVNYGKTVSVIEATK